MDFGAVLHTAQRNEKDGKKEPLRYYSTKFEPPKKQQRSKEPSINVKKFLAKKEEEERRRQEQASAKREELLALRAKDKKATRRVNVMLKRTKSANQSVIQDAVDSTNTSVTLAGPAQPDEDDYGYVSQEASAYYNKMMEKYSKIPNEPKFNFDKKKKVSTNLSSTKDRVRAALEHEKEEANMPHRRKRKHKEAAGEEEEAVEEKEPVREEQPKPKPKPKPAPPPVMNFSELLKIAQKKQFEPIIIEQKPKEEERPLTKKQKKEMEREKEWRDRKEGRLPPLDKPPPNKIPKLNSDKVNKVNGDSNRIPKVNNSAQGDSGRAFKGNGSLQDSIKKPVTSSASKPVNPFKKPLTDSERKLVIKPEGADKKPSLNHLKAPANRGPSRESVPSKACPPKTLSSNGYNADKAGSAKTHQEDFSRRDAIAKPKEFPPRDGLARRPTTGQPRPGQIQPHRDLKPKQFPPPDVRRKEFPPRGVKQKPAIGSKRRILDDDDDEYDSEMDDFIDDGPEGEEDVSKFIHEIFGYDKSKYRYLDDDVDNMESSFAQQMKEEVISTKIGIMEDLEDIKKEEEDKRRKALLKKKMK